MSFFMGIVRRFPFVGCEFTSGETVPDSIGNDRVRNNRMVLVKERGFLEVSSHTMNTRGEYRGIPFRGFV